MPASDYTSTISGGLKLKGGAKDAGVKKKSKKSKSSSKDKAAPKPSIPQDGGEVGDSKAPNNDLALSTTHSRDATPSEQQPSSSGTGKTEAQRRHEEIKRKRVSYTTKHINFATSSNRQSNVHGFSTARRPPKTRRRRQNAQAARRGAEQVPLDAVRAPRHAAHRTWLTLASCFFFFFLFLLLPCDFCIMFGFSFLRGSSLSVLRITDRGVTRGMHLGFKYGTWLLAKASVVYPYFPSRLH